LVIALCVAIIAIYGLVFLFSRIIFRVPTSVSALHALAASAPAVPFVGPAVLGGLFGGLSAVPIATAGLVINLTVVPVTILLLTLDATGRTSLAAKDKEHLAALTTKLAETVKQPIAFGRSYRWRCDAGPIQARPHRQARCTSVAEESLDPSERRIHGTVSPENAGQDHHSAAR
jgi:hypothetical protein